MKTRKLVLRVDGEDYPTKFVDSSEDVDSMDGPESAGCEGCGREVLVYFITDTDETGPEDYIIAECVSCLFAGDFESIKLAR